MSHVRVAVVVLGDLGRSPRMQYHARSLAEQGAFVDLIGCAATPGGMALLHHPRLLVHPLADPPSAGRTGQFRNLIRGIRMGRLGRALFRALLSIPRPDVILVQNPPAIPTLAVTLAASELLGARLVVDWHNFGSSMLALNGFPRALVDLATHYERWCGQHAAAHLCVSRAMANELEQHWNIPSAIVVYDQPAPEFRRAERQQTRRLFLDLGLDAVGLDAVGPESMGTADLSRTRLSHGGPALLVSSTSWTQDEDLDLLLDAAEALDETVSAEGNRHRYPDVCILVSGEGPERLRFEARAASLGLQRVKVRTLWLPFSDYATLLGSADLGLCFHRSASGWDLPMKVADMHGAGLPVCALDYGETLLEKLTPGKDGLLFRNARELAEHLRRLLDGVALNNDELFALRRNVEQRPRRQWNDEWQRTARDVLLRGAN